MGVRRLSFAAVGMAILLVLGSCSSSSSGTNHGTPQPTASSSAPISGPTITIKDFAYTGALTVKAGTKVTVVNDDSVAHTLTDKQTHKFDTGAISGGGTGSFTAPSTPGKYPFGCTIHPEMAGTLTVTS